jgi:hypothetical protein
MYFYQYYGRFDDEFSGLEIKTLKNLTSIPLEIGNIVHDVLKTLLERFKKSSEPIDQERFFNFSKNLTLNYTSANTFFETVYGNLIQVEPMEMMYPKIEACLNNFIASPRFEWLISEPEKYKKDWVIEPPGYGQTTINGFKAYCKVDFLFPTDHGLEILDWKTGQQDPVKHKKQLIAYAHWASEQKNTHPGAIDCRAVYLYPQYEEIPLDVSDSDIMAFSNQVRDETHEMWAFCMDVEQNLPMSKSEYPMVSNQENCKSCNFQKLCFGQT